MGHPFSFTCKKYIQVNKRNHLFQYIIFVFMIDSFFLNSLSTDTLDEWKFFLERIESEKSEGLFVDNTKEMRKWASFRGQTLSRTGD